MIKKSSIKNQFLILRHIFSLLPRSSKNQFWLLIAGIMLLAVIETVAVGIIAFFAAAISNPASTNQTIFIRFARLMLGDAFFATPKVMIGSLAVILVIAVVLKNLYRGVIIFSVSRFSALLEADLGARLLDAFLRQPYQWHIKQNTADLIHAIEWRRYLGRMFMTPSMNILSDCFLFGMLLLALLCINPLVFILFLVIQGGATYALYGRLRSQLDQSAASCRDYERTINREVTKAIHALKDVKISQSEVFFLESFSRNARPFAQGFARQQFWKESPLLSLETVGFTLIAASIGFMLYVLNLSPLQITGLTALLAVTAWRTLPALNRVVSSFTNIGTALPYLEIVLGYLTECSPLLSDNSTAPLRVEDQAGLVFNDAIHFDTVGFSYDGGCTPVLKELSFVIKKGEMVGVLGSSGAGKSTVVDLLTGLLKPEQGEIVIDGCVLDKVLLPRWLQIIGYVSQFPYIVDGTIAENVAFGVPIDQVDRTRVEKCCQLAAMEFIKNLPAGVDTLIGERGVRLSGGQRQRVTIARALYRNPQVLVLDEATSSLDEMTETEILDTVTKLRNMVTVIIISHKKSLLSGCNKILEI